MTEGNEYSWGAQRSRDTPTDTADTTDTTDTTGRRLPEDVSTDVPHLDRERRLRGGLSTSGRKDPPVETTLVS